jgi:hypothetical protein
MKLILVLLMVLFFTMNISTAGEISPSCTYNGIPLYGKVKIVESFADIKVKVVENFPDLKVKNVQSFPDSCGKWKYVESFPDFKIKFVDSFPDIKIKYVDSFQGINH